MCKGKPTRKRAHALQRATHFEEVRVVQEQLRRHGRRPRNEVGPDVHAEPAIAAAAPSSAAAAAVVRGVPRAAGADTVVSMGAAAAAAHGFGHGVAHSTAVVQPHLAQHTTRKKEEKEASFSGCDKGSKRLCFQW